MNRRGIHLRYTFEALGQQGAQIENPLFDLLSALLAQGSISHAALALKVFASHDMALPRLQLLAERQQALHIGPGAAKA